MKLTVTLGDNFLWQRSKSYGGWGERTALCYCAKAVPDKLVSVSVSAWQVCICYSSFFRMCSVVECTEPRSVSMQAYGDSVPALQFLLTRVPLRTSTLSRATVRSLTQVSWLTERNAKWRSWDGESRLRQSHLGVHVADHLLSLFWQLLVFKLLENPMWRMKWRAAGGKRCRQQGRRVFFFFEGNANTKKNRKSKE